MKTTEGILSDLLLINSSYKRMQEFNNVDSIDVVYRHTLKKIELEELSDYLYDNNYEHRHSPMERDLKVYLSYCTVKIYQLN